MTDSSRLWIIDGIFSEIYWQGKKLKTIAERKIENGLRSKALLEGSGGSIPVYITLNTYIDKF